jgi:hypothetical protein
MQEFRTEQSLANSTPKRGSGFRRFMRWLFVLLLVGLGLFIYWKYYFPYTSDGVKSGYLNFAVRKGQIFKTYEGKLIQEVSAAGQVPFSPMNLNSRSRTAASSISLK